jgi:hypothetical protein
VSQPNPKPGTRVVYPTAKSMFSTILRERYESGLVTYGTPLMTENGRDALWDAMEEIADGWMYLCQLWLERRDKENPLPKKLIDRLTSLYEPYESIMEEQKENNDFAHDEDE